jgi:hypothetical protein
MVMDAVLPAAFFLLFGMGPSLLFGHVTGRDNQGIAILLINEEYREISRSIRSPKSIVKVLAFNPAPFLKKEPWPMEKNLRDPLQPIPDACVRVFLQFPLTRSTSEFSRIT